MQTAFIKQCFICKLSLFSSALYAKCPNYAVLYMQTVRVIRCFICKVFLFLVLCMQSVRISSALHVQCPYYAVLYMQTVHILECFICRVDGPSRRKVRLCPCTTPAKTCIHSPCTTAYIHEWTVFPTRFSLAEVLVLVGGAIPLVPVSISGWFECWGFTCAICTFPTSNL